MVARDTDGLQRYSWWIDNRAGAVLDNHGAASPADLRGNSPIVTDGVSGNRAGCCRCGCLVLFAAKRQNTCNHDGKQQECKHTARQKDGPAWAEEKTEQWIVEVLWESLARQLLDDLNADPGEWQNKGKPDPAEYFQGGAGVAHSLFLNT